MNPTSHDRVAHLTQELERARRELRSARLMTAVPLLLLGTWVLSAGAPANQDDLAQRVSDLEARLIKGPGSTTRIQAPFEVVDRGGNVILQVMQGIPTTSNGVGIFTSGQTGGVLVSHGGTRHRRPGHGGWRGRRDALHRRQVWHREKRGPGHRRRQRAR